MVAIRHHGEPNIFGGYIKTASTALTRDSVVAFSSGQLVAATSASNSYELAGIVQEAIASTDSDYATARPIDVEVPRFKEDFFVIDVAAAKTIAASQAGTFCDLVDAVSIDPGTSTKKHVFIEAVLNTAGGANSTGQALVTFPGLKSA